jgi:hypothetical protein
METTMNRSEQIYTAIVNENLSGKNRLNRILEEARKLEQAGERDVATSLIDHALRGSIFFPDQKQQLRAFKDTELKDQGDKEA